MQFLSLQDNTKLKDLTNIVGQKNLESVLHLNGLTRTPNIGKQFKDACDEIIGATTAVDVGRKIALLSGLTNDTDIFESAALMDDDGWKLLSSKNTLPGKLRIPSTMSLPDSVNVLGDGNPVPKSIFEKVSNDIRNSGAVDPSVFNTYSVANSPVSVSAKSMSGGGANPMQWFLAPFGDITLHSSLDDSRIDFPVYPEELTDSVKANYTQMPDMLYQYEPWQIYSSSGPRTMPFNFHFHRDMWTGDHRDGKANELIRACEANCYADYKGSAVYTSIVTMYIFGKAVIRGIMTDVNVDWSGPIGLDGWWLECKLSFNITEVSQTPLNFNTVKAKGLIG